MNILHIMLGIGLILIGGWLAIVQGKNLMDGKPNSLGGISGLLMCGIGSIIFGIIEIVQAI
jgi:hypothetical protein